jgi:hypothetical protein
MLRMTGAVVRLLHVACEGSMTALAITGSLQDVSVRGRPTGVQSLTLSQGQHGLVESGKPGCRKPIYDVVQLVGIGDPVVVLPGAVDVFDIGEGGSTQRLIAGWVSAADPWAVGVAGSDVGSVVLDQRGGSPVGDRLPPQ